MEVEILLLKTNILAIISGSREENCLWTLIDLNGGLTGLGKVNRLRITKAKVIGDQKSISRVNH